MTFLRTRKGGKPAPGMAKKPTVGTGMLGGVLAKKAAVPLGRGGMISKGPGGALTKTRPIVKDRMGIGRPPGGNRAR